MIGRLIASMPQVSIVIPAFNEERAIAGVVLALKALPIDPEVIVVDDGSTDDTAHVAEQSGARVVRHAGNAGYGASLKDGIDAANCETIVISDADGTYPIEKIPHLVAIFNKGFHMVVGARQGKEYRGSFFKMPARIIFKFLAEFTTGRNIPDVNSGLRVFRKSEVKQFFPDLCNGFSFTTTITLVYMLTGKTVAYEPIPYEKRIGRSKVKILRDSVRTLQYMTEVIVRYNPLKLFLLLAILTFLWGIPFAIFIDVFALFLAGIGAMIVFGIGLLAEAARKKG